MISVHDLYAIIGKKEAAIVEQARIIEQLQAKIQELEAKKPKKDK